MNIILAWNEESQPRTVVLPAFDEVEKCVGYDIGVVAGKPFANCVGNFRGHSASGGFRPMASTVALLIEYKVETSEIVNWGLD